MHDTTARAAALAAYEAGEPVKAICAAHHITRSTLHLWRVRAGLPPRPRQGAVRVRAAIAAAPRATLRAIAEAADVTPGYVARLRRHQRKDAPR
jgi:hypothetical protein